MRRLADLRREPSVSGIATEKLIEHIAQTQATATRGQVGADLHVRGVQGDVATSIDRQRTVNNNLIAGRDLERTEPETIKLIVIQIQLALALLGHCGAQV